MTCLAYRDGVLAADTAILCGDMVYPGKNIKIARRDDGVLIGGSGDSGWCSLFIGWVLDGCEGDLPEIQNTSDGHSRAEGVMIHPSGKIAIYTDSGAISFQADYWASGSGAPFALGAFFMGADAIGAVDAAIAHDIGCGGEAYSLRH